MSISSCRSSATACHRLTWGTMAGMTDETQPDQPADDLTVTVTVLPDWVQEAIRFEAAEPGEDGD